MLVVHCDLWCSYSYGFVFQLHFPLPPIIYWFLLFNLYIIQQKRYLKFIQKNKRDIWGIGVLFSHASCCLCQLRRRGLTINCIPVDLPSFSLIYLVVNRLLLEIIFCGTHWGSAHLLLQRTCSWQMATQRCICCDFSCKAAFFYLIN
jgi:hypothetical protein